MKKFFLLAFMFVLPFTTNAQGILNSALPKNADKFHFCGVYLGFQASHVASEPFWMNYDRVIVVSSGVKWRQYIRIGGEFGVPVYRSYDLPRKTYVMLRVDLRLL